MSKLRLEVLSQEEIATIQQRTLDVLERVGVKVLDAECRRVLAKAGAKVDEATLKVYLPARLVQEALSQAPATYEIQDQTTHRKVVGGDGRIYGSLVTDPWIIDYASGKPRRPILNDIVRHTRLGDAHPMVSIIHRMDMPPMDVDQDIAYIKSLEAFVTNTTKHLVSLPSSDESTRDWLEVAEILAGSQGLAGRPIMTFGIAVTSPLTFTDVNAHILREAVRYQFPIIPVICPMAGTTSPLSFAGTLLISNCENIFLIALTQLMRPGTPIAYASGQSIIDLRTGHDIYYNADKSLWKAANTQMGRSYHLPVSSETGGSMVGRYDVQAGIEASLLMLPTIACGQNVMNGLGSNYNACGMSAEMIVMQADLAALLERISAGIDVSEDKLAFDSIVAAGPGGHFLEDPLTIRMLRSGEFFTAGSFDRLGERSPNDPADSMLAHAHARVEELLAQHTPAVPPAVVEEIGRWARRKEQVVRKH